MTLKESIAKISGWSQDSFKVEELDAGGNNKPFKVYKEDIVYFIKKYFRDKSDPRNRGLTEFNFSQLIWSQGIRNIPEPFFYDDEENIGIFSFIEGYHPDKQIDHSLLIQACTFFDQINSYRQSSGANSLAPASEACFSIDSHIQTIKNRLSRLVQLPTDTEIEIQANQFIKNELLASFQSEVDNLNTNFTGDLQNTILNKSERCLSPSDFGFHNAKINNEILYFFDFEYAGWDDPAKTVCDFFYQPKYPVPTSEINFFTAQIAKSIEIPYEHLIERANILLPFYKIKWCSIALNDFLPSGNRRRLFANQVDEQIRKQSQLLKARDILNRDVHIL
jgi:hypothetical protein